jgi:hypothetical protein
MTLPRPLPLALALAVVPACGHKGPPQRPRRNTPPSLVDFAFAQRGEGLEVSCTAPGASIDGVAFRSVDVEIFWGEGQVDLEKGGQRRTVTALPGERILEQLPLPAAGTLVRAAARAVVGRSRGQRTLILALEAQPPVVPPRELGAWLREKGVTLNWKGPMPERVEAPDLGQPTPFRDPFAKRPEPEDQGSPGSVETLGDEGAAKLEDENATPAEATAEEAPAQESPDEETEETEEASGDDADAADAEAVAEDLPRGHGFRVYRRLEGAPWGVPLNYEPQPRRIFTDTAAPVGRTVCYVVRAVASVDPRIESEPSNEACLEVKDILPPSPPSGLAVVPRDGGLEVVWSPSADAGLASYRIYRSAGGEEPEQVGEAPAGTTTWLDTSGEGGILYRYTVTSVDGAGNEGPPSGSAEGIHP